MMNLKRNFSHNKLLTMIYRNMSDEEFNESLMKAIRLKNVNPLSLMCMRIYLKENPTKTIDDYNAMFSSQAEFEEYAYKKVVQPMLKEMDMDESDFLKIKELIEKG